MPYSTGMNNNDTPTVTFSVSVPHAPWEIRVATIGAAAEILGSCGQSRQVSHITPGGLRSIQEAERIEFMTAIGAIK